MRDLALLTFLSLDGVMQGPTSAEEDPSNGFTVGGWGMPYWDEVMDQVKEEAMTEPYDILFGRTTYEMFAASWPHLSDENPTAKMMNGAKKYVVTSSVTSNIDWQNTTRITGDVVTEIRKIKDQDGPLLQVHGSCGLIQTLLAQNLVDEIRLWTFPVLLGQGKRLFGPDVGTGEFELVKTRATSNGVTMGIYRSA